MKSTPTILLVALLLGAGTWARAEPKPAATAGDSDVEEARQRFQRGVELYRESSFDAALAEFNKAYQLAPNYRVLYNLAQVQAERHDYVSAMGFFTQYLEQGGSEISAERREHVEQELAALKTRVAELSIRADVDGADVVVDGISVGQLPLQAPVLVSSGVRQLQVRKAGYSTSTRTLTIAGGDKVNLVFQMQREPAVAAASSTPATSAGRVPQKSAEGVDGPRLTASHGSRAPMWISLAATGVLAGGAVTFGVLTSKANRDLDNELNRIPADSHLIDDRRSELKRNAALTDTFTAASVVAGCFFLYFVISGPSTAAPRREAARTSLRLAPAGPGLRMLGEF